MKILFIHQNFPGQYKHLAPHYAADPRNTVVSLGEERSDRPIQVAGLRHVSYPKPGGANGSTHHYLHGTEASIRRGQAVFRAAYDLAREGFRPDVICVHPGWGEGLFLKDAFPHARVLSYWEFYYCAKGQDVGFDPEIGQPTIDEMLAIRMKNATQLLSFQSSDWGISPTHWQRSLFPAPWRALISPIHEGVDTDAVRPNPRVVLNLADHQLELTPADEVITYVSRNLEPYRGFHVFMRALPELLRRRPKARVLLVGGEGVSYGRAPADGQTWREKMMAEVGADLDMSRVHFLGKVPYRAFLGILQVSSAHVYLTYPFVLSWSMLEAMSAGCLIVGSRTGPVEEVITDGVNGLLVDFLNPAGVVERVCEALENRDQMVPIRQRARQTVIERYDLKRVCLPQQLALIESLAARG